MNAILLRKIDGVLAACIRQGTYVGGSVSTPACASMASVALALCLMLVPVLLVIGFLAALFGAPTPTVSYLPDWMIGVAFVGALKTGTMTVQDLLANETPALEADLEEINEVLQDDIRAHNAIVEDMVSEVADLTTERQVAEGTGETGEMVEVAEDGRAPTQKVSGYQTRAIPMRGFQYALGWTRKWAQQNTVAEMARQVLASEKAHLKKVVAQLRRAIFQAANYSYTDYLVAPKITLDVKRFYNADSSEIPEGPFGETFDGATHTHYLANATLTAAVAKNLINTIVEHGFGKGVRVAIAQADVDAWKALTGFTAYPDPRLILGTHTNQPGQRTDITVLDDVAIGIFNQAEVWVKPWAIANYPFAYDTLSKKPVAFRQRTGGVRGLVAVADIDLYPWQIKYLEAEFGFGVQTRGNGAVLRSNNAAYADPTISG